MRTGGLLLVAAGAVLIYWVLRAGLKSELSSSPSSSSSGGGGGGGSSGGGANPSSADIGTHQAIDTTGTQTGTIGAVYTVNSTYGDATDQQQGDMNAFAHASGG
jgi:hypothetical protein